MFFIGAAVTVFLFAIEVPSAGAICGGTLAFFASWWLLPDEVNAAINVIGFVLIVLFFCIFTPLVMLRSGTW